MRRASLALFALTVTTCVDGVLIPQAMAQDPLAHRKAELTIQVLDTSGRPVEGVELDIRTGPAHHATSSIYRRKLVIEPVFW